MAEISSKVLLLRHIVDEADDMTTVSHVLRGRLKLSQRLYRRLKRENGIVVAGCQARADTVVKTGDAIELLTDAEGSADTIAEEIPLDIVHEDSSVILLNKPPGICVHPTHGHWTGTLANGVAEHFHRTGVMTRVRPVHRLDMDTSGLVLFAKSQLAHQKLAVQLDSGTMGRRYLAVVRGLMDDSCGTITGAIARNPHCPKERTVAEDGREAVTHYRVLRRLEGACLVELTLDTGRTHQIRVHMAHIGHPLIGDPMYLKDVVENTVPFHRQALHAYSLEFDHPADGRHMVFQTSLPQDIVELVERLEGVLREGDLIGGRLRSDP